ncbi:hypothetical protein, partial [Brachybacterium sp. HMSC06H03]|uniref:hypothetical protein n=1 Tax=Brachybacterium sp. HMSC06H03 TaxID=1581127 RepID=UPI000B17D2D8
GPSSGPGSPAPGAVAVAGQQTLSAAQATATLRKVGIGTPVPTLVTGALAYLVALLAALVVIVSAVLAVLTADTGASTDPTGGAAAPATDDAGFAGIIGLLGIPFQLVALASFGSYDAELQMGFLGSLSLSWRGLPLLITAAMTVFAFLAARTAQRRWSSNGPLGALLWSGLSGLGVALVALLVTRLTAVSIEDPANGLSLSMHAAGADMFFGTWTLITLPLLLGHLAGMRKPDWWPLVADLAAAPRLVLVHALAFAVPVGLLALAAGTIAQIVDGEGRSVLGALLALPLWGPTALALLPGLGMLVVPVRASTRGDVGDLGLGRGITPQSGTQSLWFVDLPWYVWLPMVLIALLVPLLIALLWHRDREIPAGNVLAQFTSWAALPLAYTFCALVLLALVHVRMDAEMGFLGAMGVSMSLAAWMPVVAFFLGLAVEVIARFGAPFVDRFVPGPLVNWFRRSARARRAESAAPAAPVGEDGWSWTTSSAAPRTGDGRNQG